MSVLHLFFIHSNSLWGLPTPTDRKLWLNIISMQAGGNSVHKYSILITDVRKTNFPTTAGGKAAFSKPSLLIDELDLHFVNS